jgi:RNA polymerase sigma factor (sigma-70 family)
MERKMKSDIWLKEVYPQYNKKVYYYFLKRLHSAEEAEDLTSAVFLELTRYADRYDKNRASESTWIYAICRNLCNRYLRDKNSHKRIVYNFNNEKIYRNSRQKSAVEYPARSHSASEADYAGEFERFFQMDLLCHGFSRLSNYKRTVLIFSYYTGLSAEEIAEGLGISNTNVRVLKSRGLKELSRILVNR